MLKQRMRDCGRERGGGGGEGGRHTEPLSLRSSLEEGHVYGLTGFFSSFLFFF